MLSTIAERYIDLHLAVGYRFRDESDLLRNFARYATAQGDTLVRTETALAWAAQSPSAGARRRRLVVVRRFSQRMRLEDPGNELPPPDTFGPRPLQRLPYIFAPESIRALLDAAASLGPPGSLRPKTYATLFGLLSCTGLRISEALNLRPQDFDATGQTLLIQPSKFSPARRLPLQTSASVALNQYDQFCQQTLAQATRPAFFLNGYGRPLTRDYAEAVFAQVRARLGWTHDPVPRLHDLRHTFAVHCLVGWNRQAGGVDAKILALATYLGHRRVTDTYWYLSAIPQLLASSAARFEQLAHSTPEVQSHA